MHQSTFPPLSVFTIGHSSTSLPFAILQHVKAVGLQFLTLSQLLIILMVRIVLPIAVQIDGYRLSGCRGIDDDSTLHAATALPPRQQNVTLLSLLSLLQGHNHGVGHQLLIPAANIRLLSTYLFHFPGVPDEHRLRQVLAFFQVIEIETFTTQNLLSGLCLNLHALRKIPRPCFVLSAHRSSHHHGNQREYKSHFFHTLCHFCLVNNLFSGANLQKKL